MIRDCRHEEVEVRRYRCTGCGKTFRDYPEGVTPRQESQRPQALSVLLYVLGLAYDGVSTVLEALGCGLGKTAVGKTAVYMRMCRQLAKKLKGCGERGWRGRGVR